MTKVSEGYFADFPPGQQAVPGSRRERSVACPTCSATDPNQHAERGCPVERTGMSGRCPAGSANA